MVNPAQDQSNDRGDAEVRARLEAAVSHYASAWGINAERLQNEITLSFDWTTARQLPNELAEISASLDRLSQSDKDFDPVHFWNSSDGGIPARRASLGISGYSTLKIVADELRRIEMSLYRASTDPDYETITILRINELKVRWRYLRQGSNCELTTADIFDILRQMISIGVQPMISSLTMVLGGTYVGPQSRRRIVRKFFTSGECNRVFSPRKPYFLASPQIRRHTKEMFLSLAKQKRE